MPAPEATITQYGISIPGPVITRTISDAFSYPAYLVKVDTVKAGGFNQFVGTTSPTDVPSGFTIKSCVPATMEAMVNVSEGAAQAGQAIGVQALIPGQEVYLELGAATAAVAIGDFLAPSTTSGVVGPRNATTGLYAAVVVARALDSALANAGGTIRCTIIAPMYVAASVSIS